MHPRRLAPLRATLVAGLFLGILAAALLSVPGPGAEVALAEPPVIYKWVDEHGVAHYTTDRSRIPSAIRDRIVQGSDSARHGDWLRRDAGEVDPSAPAPAATAVRDPASFPGDAESAAGTPSTRRPADGVEVPEHSDGVHAVTSEPDWSQAPGGEAEWAPGELGEDDDVAAIPPRDSAPQSPAESPPAVSAASAPMPTVATPDLVPPPPPPPLEADGAPVATPAIERSQDAPARVPVRGGGSFASGSELPFDEPAAPATVAAPAPAALAPDERAKLEQLDREIADIEREISRDEETLMVVLSETEGANQASLVDDPRFRDVAQRLPRLQADLERLREQRDRIQPRVTRQ